MDTCPFCTIEPARVWIETEHAVAFGDAYPVADGHTLVAPRKHVNTIYELTILEQEALWDLVAAVRARLLTGLMPQGFSVGFNDTRHEEGSAHHAAIHVSIPVQVGR